jgi:hypothetical protein
MHHQLRGVGDGDGEAAFGLLQRHEVVAEHHVHGDGLEELVLDLEVLQVDELGVVAAGEHLRALGLGECVVAVRDGDRDGGHGVGLSGLNFSASTARPRRSG